MLNTSIAMLDKLLVYVDKEEVVGELDTLGLNCKKEDNTMSYIRKLPNGKYRAEIRKKQPIKC